MTDLQASLRSLKIRMILYATAIVVMDFLIFWFVIWPVISYDVYRFELGSEAWNRLWQTYLLLSQIWHIAVGIIIVATAFGILVIYMLFKKYAALKKENITFKRQAAG